MAAGARSTQEVRRDELEGLASELKAALEARGEGLSPGWPEEVVENLVHGRLVGFCAPSDDPGRALAFFSVRPGRAYGHVHVGPGPGGAQRAAALTERLVGELPPDIPRLDFGLTGLAGEEEERFDRDLAARPCFAVTRRHALERAFGGPESPGSRPVPSGFRLSPVRSVSLDRLSELHLAAFRGTPDEPLVASSPPEDRRVLEEILSDRLGRFLEEASTVLVDDAGRPVGFVLTAEQDPRRALFLDLVVAPAMRRRGLGRFLLVWALRALWAFGFERGRLWVTDANRPARELYDHLGFVPVASAGVYGWRRASTSGPQ